MGTLYVVATPIGNLKDISLRALEILKHVDLIAAEDTRKTIKLLNHYQIITPQVSYHQHSRPEKIDLIIEKLIEGKNVALVTEAGTPGIADPGQVLIEKAQKAGILLVPIPGPQAAVAALSVSGFSTDKFLFAGFLPKKKGRQKLLNNLARDCKIAKVIVFYESPYRIIKTLNDLAEYFGDAEIMVGRELTKKFETIYRGKISQIIPQIKPKGEFVIVIQKSKLKDPKAKSKD